MMTRTVLLNRLAFLMLLLPSLAVLSACGDEQVDALVAIDDAYDVALNACNGTAAVEFLSEDTIKLYDRVVKNARTLSAAKTRALPYTEMYEVLQARLLFSRDELKKMDGRGYKARIVSTGKYGSTSHMERTRTVINTERTRAVMSYLDRRSDELHDGIWVFEKGTWKADEAADGAAADRYAIQEARDRRIGVEDLALETLEMTWEKDAPANIWEPKR